MSISPESPALKAVIASCIIVICLAVMYPILVRGFGDDVYSSVQPEFRRWLNNELPYTDLKTTFDNVSSFVDHPRMNSVAARMYHNCFRGSAICNADDGDYGALSADVYRKTISQRPKWADNYAYFARLKADQGVFDEEFHRVFEAAKVYGPNEANTLTLLSEVIVERWYHFSGEKRKQNAGVFITGLSSKRGAVYRQHIDALKKISTANVGQLDPILLAAIDEWLGELDVKQYRKQLNIVLILWSHWAPEQKISSIQLIQRLTNSIGVKVILNQAKRSGHLRKVCPILPQTKYVANACSNKSLPVK